jgi:hypothetical protein
VHRRLRTGRTEVYVTYDDSVDAVYISFIGEVEPGASAKTYRSDHIGVDGMTTLDAQGG